MTTIQEEKNLHRIFLASVWIKALVGVGQIVAGTLLLLVRQATLTAFMLRASAPELTEDPHDWVASLLRTSANEWSTGTHTFASLYLIVHGVIKVLLVAGLLRRKMWSYPVSMWVLGAFIAYQLYRYSFTHSIWLILLSALDAVVIVLIHHEYRVRKQHGFTH
jgi:uncharacterized membrane protein